jgi:hypothetical protein
MPHKLETKLPRFSYASRLARNPVERRLRPQPNAAAFKIERTVDERMWGPSEVSLDAAELVDRQGLI